MGLFYKGVSEKITPKDVAKDRLKLILIHDRGELDDETLEVIKGEISKVISKYIDISLDEVEVTVNNDSQEKGGMPAIVASIPIKSLNAGKLNALSENLYDDSSLDMSPKNIAKDRLKLILIHDRGQMDPKIIEKMREETLEVLTDYIDITLDDVEISINRNSEEGSPASELIANFPIRNLRGR